MGSPDLLLHIALAMALAGGAAALAARLGQSVILGYLLAGFLIGPNSPGFVGDQEVVDAFANIGVVLLLFTLGVQLSVPSLLRVGGISAWGAIAQVSISILLGWAVGRAFGWDPVEALFLGAVISNSSSTVISKVLGDRDEVGSLHGLIAIGWSSVQDLSTVLLVAILTTLSSEGTDLGRELLNNTARAAVFLSLVVLAGPPLLSRLFELIARLNNREVFVLLATGLALGMAYMASQFGLSPALGAFVGGIVLRESDVLHEIEDRLSSLRDIFAGLFFVSMGMLLDIRFVLDNWWFFTAAIALIVLVKGSLSTAITLLARYPLRTAILAGLALAQSAEFSLIMARVGLDLGVLSEERFSLLVAASAASVALAAPLMRAGDPLATRLEERLTPRVPSDEPDVRLMPEHPRGHAIVCGHGRAGRVLAEVLRSEGFLVVVIEADRDVVESIRERGLPALAGNAGNTVLLDRANVAEAKVLAIAVPDPATTRQIVRYARQVNPTVEIVARTHSEAERKSLQAAGVREAVMAERELGFEMARYALYRLGVGAIEASEAIDRRRVQEERA